MMKIAAYDPGKEKTAYVIWDGEAVIDCAIVPNNEALEKVRVLGRDKIPLAVEQIRCYGMPVGADILDTVHWCGRFQQAYEDSGGDRFHLMTRHDVKMHLNGTKKAKDANVRQALLDRFGPVGTKKKRGPLFGVGTHIWAALAVAVTTFDQFFAGEIIS